MKSKLIFTLSAIVLFSACQKIDVDFDQHKNAEDISSLEQISSTTVGGEAAAEISAFDPKTNKLFVISNADELTEIIILDISNPASPLNIGTIDVSPYGGGVNSVDVSDGILAAAIQGNDKTDNGKIVFFKTSDYSVVSQVTVGALPDMVEYSPDGKLVISANEGEPSADYSNDPVGTVSIISVKDYSVTTLDFSAFESQESALKAKGFRIFGKNASFAEDIEPEYATISADSRTAWVTLQENNGIARIDLVAKKVINIFPLGFKDYSVQKNYIDPSDANKAYLPGQWDAKGIYMPDGIAVVEEFGIPFLFTANEGDAREYPDAGFVEVKRVKAVTLDAAKFPNAATLQADLNLGKLNITTTLGDIGNDGDFDELYSLGARSFSVWNGLNGQLLFDSENDLDELTSAASLYDDGRSDDKSVEPESVIIGTVGKQKVAFVGMERADAVAVYDLSSCYTPKFMKMLKVGDAPEGLLFISAKDSPSKKSLLVVSSEGDGTVKIFETK